MLFDEKTKMRLDEVFSTVKNKARFVPFELTVCGLSFVAVCFSIILEGHLIYKLFQNLGGNDSQYWSPELMSLTAGVMILGFHILAREQKNSFAVRFVNKCTQYLIPIYLVGVGLIIAGMVVGDRIGSLFSVDTIKIGGFSEQPKNSGLEALFTSISHPIATVFFSIGIGGLAIINIFIAHKLIDRIEHGVSESILSIQTFRAIKVDYDLALNCHEDYLENEFDFGDLELQSDDLFLADQQASIALSAINEALAPHEEFIKNQQLMIADQQLAINRPNDDIDLKQLEKFISKIKTIDFGEIKKIMLSRNSQEKKK